MLGRDAGCWVIYFLSLAIELSKCRVSCYILALSDKLILWPISATFLLHLFPPIPRAEIILWVFRAARYGLAISAFLLSLTRQLLSAGRTD